MKNMRKWILGALLLVMFGILSGCGKKEAVAENENLPGEGFWDFVEQKCDSLKPDVLPEKMKLLSFYGSKDGEEDSWSSRRKKRETECGRFYRMCVSWKLRSRMNPFIHTAMWGSLWQMTLQIRRVSCVRK